MISDDIRALFTSKGEVAKALRWCAGELCEDDPFIAAIMHLAAEMLEESENESKFKQDDEKAIE